MQKLSGTIPDAVGSMIALESLDLSSNILRGPIPHAVGTMIALESLDLRYKILRDPIPHAGSMQGLEEFLVRSFPSESSDNKSRGPIPHAVGAWTRLRDFDVHGNDLSGPIPHSVGSWTPVSNGAVGHNSLRGPLPHAFGSWSRLEELELNNNLRGPHTCCPHATVATLVSPATK